MDMTLCKCLIPHGPQSVDAQNMPKTMVVLYATCIYNTHFTYFRPTKHRSLGTALLFNNK